MTFWRMQLHPNDSGQATKYAALSLVAGMIGLDHSVDIGDMRKSDPAVLPPSQRDYFHLATRMQIGDKVLVEAHHFPFAFATVASDYFYITAAQPELNVWFRHFRRVKDVRFVGDIVTNPKKWPQLTMTSQRISKARPFFTGTRTGRFDLLNQTALLVQAQPSRIFRPAVLKPWPRNGPRRVQRD